MVKNNNDKWGALSMSERASFINKIIKEHNISDLKTIKSVYNEYSSGGRILDGESEEEGGYSKESLQHRKGIHASYDPTNRFNAVDQIIVAATGGNNAKGEEDQYWRAYLGLTNDVPKMNPNAKTSWDDNIEAKKVAKGELPSDFYSTTPRMDLNIQAIADTLNTGRILRDYDSYKQANPDLPPQWKIEEMYETGKRILDNPKTWQQVDGDRTAVKEELDDYLNEANPLGMLANFGMMWNPEEEALYMHDTYDFPKWARIFVGDRPKEMKIRSKISFDPKKGSKLLREGMKYFYNYPEAITNALGGPLYNKHNPIESFSGSSKIPVVRKSLT